MWVSASCAGPWKWEVSVNGRFVGQWRVCVSVGDVWVSGRVMGQWKVCGSLDNVDQTDPEGLSTVSCEVGTGPGGGALPNWAASHSSVLSIHCDSRN